MIAGRARALAAALLLAAAGAVGTVGGAAAAPRAAADGPDPDDPYRSYAWLDIRRELIGDAPMRFEPRVVVRGPDFAEDPMNVPVSVRVDPALGAVERIVVVVDRNPIRRVLEFEPMQALPAISFRFKLEQASPVRAVVKLRQGGWVVGGTWIESAGGGCTVAGASRRDGSWSTTLGDISARLFERGGEGGAATRLRLQVMHPMDTGLVAGIPAFFVDRLSVRDAQGHELARLSAYEPVSENPVFSVDFAVPPPGGVRIAGGDNNGNRFARQLVP